jgi:hypothetical protein
VLEYVKAAVNAGVGDVDVLFNKYVEWGMDTANNELSVHYISKHKS